MKKSRRGADRARRTEIVPSNLDIGAVRRWIAIRCWLLARRAGGGGGSGGGGGDGRAIGSARVVALASLVEDVAQEGRLVLESSNFARGGDRDRLMMMQILRRRVAAHRTVGRRRLKRNRHARVQRANAASTLIPFDRIVNVQQRVAQRRPFQTGLYPACRVSDDDRSLDAAVARPARWRRRRLFQRGDRATVIHIGNAAVSIVPTRGQQRRPTICGHRRSGRPADARRRPLLVQLTFDAQILHLVHFQNGFTKILAKLGAVMVVTGVKHNERPSIHPLR